MKLYLIRHGQTDWNLSGKIQGRQDVPLNETGRKQALSLAEAMDSRPVSRVFSSPQKRAYETARAVAERQQVPLLTVFQLAELGYGSWEGRTMKEILEHDRELYEAWWQEPGLTAPPGGETRRDVERRCQAAWLRMLAGLKEDAAIVTHGGTLAVLMAQALQEPQLAGSLMAGNASITTLEYEREIKKFKALEFGDVKHLM